MITQQQYDKKYKELRRQRKKKEIIENEFWNARSVLGNDWAIFFFFLGGREAGKSYTISNLFAYQFVQKGRPFYWLRLTEKSAGKLLQNNAEKLIDPDIRRRLNLDLTTNGDCVYAVTRRGKDGRILEKKLMARVLALSTFYNDKGSGLFDADFLKDPNMYYNICLDEMNREKNEKNSFDIVYSFVNQLENLVRSTKKRIRVICIGNTLEEASDLLCAINFIPEEFGRYKIRKKRAVIDYIEPTEKYKQRRSGTIADLLTPEASTFTNKIEVDKALISKRRLKKPTMIIKFTKERDTWFTVWDGNIISRYNKEQNKTVVAMRPYLDEKFITQLRDNVMLLFDTRCLYFKDLITFKLFQKELELLKPRK